MNIVIVGAGNVGRALATGWTKAGHKITLVVRDPASSKAGELKQQGFSVVAANEAAATAAEVIVLAVPWSALATVVKGLGSLAGKVVIDVTNPIADAPPVNGVVKFFTNLDESLMERSQREFPQARFVKAFSSVGKDFMINPNFKAGKPTMFICGNDEAAKQTVRGVLDQFGWETADMGMAEAARAIEPLCMLWLIPGFLRNEWNHAFKLLRLE